MPLDEALSNLLDRAAAATPLACETVATWDADGRVLAQDLIAELEVPGFDNSAMDGYAVRLSDLLHAGAEASFEVSQRVAAGAAGDAPLASGTVARIFTGAPVPPGADAVVIQEDSVVDADGRVRFTAEPRAGQNIRRAGEDVARGQAVLEAGQRLSAAHLGLAASIGAARLTVCRKPRVALLSTGDELAMPGEVAPADLPRGGVFNSNRFFLRALLQRLGCEVTDLGIVPDRLDATRQTLAQAARDHDVIVTSGGVSVGEEDHVKPAVQALGSLELWQVAIKPGKPFAYGRVRRDASAAGLDDAAHFIGLPGNPVSSYVTGLVLLRPFLLRLQGRRDIVVQALPAMARFTWDAPDPKRREFLRVRLDASGALERHAHQGSGVLTSVAWADGLVDNPAGQTIAPGDVVRFLPFSAFLD